MQSWGIGAGIGVGVGVSVGGSRCRWSRCDCAGAEQGVQRCCAGAPGVE